MLALTLGFCTISNVPFPVALYRFKINDEFLNCVLFSIKVYFVFVALYIFRNTTIFGRIKFYFGCKYNSNRWRVQVNQIFPFSYNHFTFGIKTLLFEDKILHSILFFLFLWWKPIRLGRVLSSENFNVLCVHVYIILIAWFIHVLGYWCLYACFDDNNNKILQNPKVWVFNVNNLYPGFLLLIAKTVIILHTVANFEFKKPSYSDFKKVL